MKQRVAAKVLTLFLLSAAGLVSRANAATILYNINFGTAISGMAPTSGSFDYDSLAPLGNQFSNFIVVWDGLSFNVTANANTPTLNSAGSCTTSGFTSATVFSFLDQTPECPSAPNTYTWQVIATGGPDAQINFFDTNQAGTGDVELSDALVSTLIGPYSSGYYTITPAATPEPSTFFLMLTTGGMFLLRKQIVSRRRSK